MKTCKDCARELSVDDFYPNTRRCKSCTKAAVRANYRRNREHYKKYDQERLQRPERKAAAIVYQRQRRARSPEKYLARQAVARALKNGTLIKLPCEVCGAKAQAHHIDYSKPLEVRWLCFVHHRMEHGQLLDLVADAAFGLSP